MEKNFVREAGRTLFFSLIANLILFAVKIVAGIIAGSSAVVSDAIDSLADVFTAVIVMLGIKLSAKKSDKGHPFGHERIECIVALILAAALAGTGLAVGYGAVNSVTAIIKGAIPSHDFYYFAMGTAILSVAVKLILYIITERTAKKFSSTALHGDAINYLGDIFSSAASFIGLLGSMLGAYVLEPVACFIICLFIFRSAAELCVAAADRLVDKAADEATEKKITDIALTSGGVLRVDVLRTRLYGNRIFVEMEIAVDSSLTLINAHMIAERVHERVERGIPEVKHCMVHVNPMLKSGEEPDNHEKPEKEWD